jgi:hypothetical protein
VVGRLRMKLYDGFKSAVARGLLFTTLSTGGLVGLVNAQEPKFTPIKVNTLQENVDDILVYVSFYQTEKPNELGIYPVQVKVYFEKRRGNVLPTSTRVSEVLDSTSDRCFVLTSYKKKKNDSVVVELSDYACKIPNDKETIRTKYERVGQGDFKKVDSKSK